MASTSPENRHRCVLLLVLLSAACCPKSFAATVQNQMRCRDAEDEWYRVGPEPPHTAIAYSPWIATAQDPLDNDVIYTAFADADNIGRLRVQSRRISDPYSAWEAVGQPGFSQAVQPSAVKLVVDASGRPIVAFRAEEAPNGIHVWRFSGRTWKLLGGEDWTAGRNSQTSVGLAVDLYTNKVYVGYSDRDHEGRVTVMTFDGESWVPVGPEGFTAGGTAEQGMDLAINPFNSQLYVAMVDSRAEYRASVYTLVDGAWAPVGSMGFSAGRIESPRLACDARDGSVYAAFVDNAEADGPKASVYKFGGPSAAPDGEWIPLGDERFSRRHPLDLRIALDKSTGQVYVSLSDPYQMPRVYTWCGGTSSWQELMGDTRNSDLASRYADSMGLLVDPAAGKPIVAFIDYQQVFVYAFGDSPYPDAPQCPSATQDWRMVGPTPPRNAVSFSPVAAAQHTYDNDVIYSAFADKSAGGRLRVQSRRLSDPSGAWEVVGQSGFSRVRYPASIKLAVDPGGRPVAAFMDSSAGIYVWMYFHGIWKPLGGEDWSAGYKPIRDSLGMAVDQTTNQVFVGFCDQYRGGSATVMTFDGKSWVPVGAEGFTKGWVKGAVELAINPVNNQLYAAFVDPPSDSKASVFTFVDGTWAPVGTRGFSGGSIATPGLAFDARDGSVYAAFVEINHDELRASVYKYGGFSASNKWDLVGGASFSSGYPWNTRVAVDGTTGQVYVSLSDLYASKPRVYTLCGGVNGASTWQELVGDDTRLAAKFADNTYMDLLANPGTGKPVLAFIEGPQVFVYAMGDDSTSRSRQ